MFVIPINTLEIQMSSIIRAGLRKAMEHSDARNLDRSLSTAEDRLTTSLYEPLYRQILKTYTEGYVDGGALIYRYAPPGTVVLAAAAAPTPLEDPRIATATKSVVYGVKDSLGNHKNEIQALIRSQLERGATFPQISRQLEHYFDGDRVAADRFARTATTDIYNRARLDRYEDSGVVDGVEYSAHIDTRTTDICRMLDGTIWALGDRGIRVPPSHLNCRSNLLPYFGDIPGARNFTTEFGSEFVNSAEKTSTIFRSKYWSPMPHTKASATYHRAYFPKSDIKTISTGLSLLIKETRILHVVPDVAPLERLKAILRYRKTNAVKSTISDRFGQSLLLDKFEERDIVRAIKGLIVQADSRIAREAAKRKRIIGAAWKSVTDTRKGISKIEKDIRYYKARMKADPTNAVSYQKIITSDTKRLNTLRSSEERRIVKWKDYKAMKPSATTIRLEAEKERYEAMLKGFEFKKR